MKDRKLILVRHAHRTTAEGRERDNGLSDKGRDQAKAIGRYFRERFPREDPILLASPKVRCIETLLPLSDKLKVQIQIVDSLDEQHESESLFNRRVEKFFRWWKQRAPETVIACSHGDWIPAFTRLAIGTEVDMKKGGWLEIESVKNTVKLRWLLQKLP